MGTPGWRSVTTVEVPDQPGRLWTVAVEYVTPGRLYRLSVKGSDKGEQKWKPDGSEPCTADGDPSLSRNAGVPIPDARIGALIGRIGGSTADSAGPQDRALLFSIGRQCVIQAPDASTLKIGSLFLGINDVPSGAAKLEQSLKVEILEAL